MVGGGGGGAGSDGLYGGGAGGYRTATCVSLGRHPVTIARCCR